MQAAKDQQEKKQKSAEALAKAQQELAAQSAEAGADKDKIEKWYKEKVAKVCCRRGTVSLPAITHTLLVTTRAWSHPRLVPLSHPADAAHS